jgi:hypothetical protein
VLPIQFILHLADMFLYGLSCSCCCHVLSQVSPLVSYAGEGLERLVAGREISDAYDLDLQVGPTLDVGVLSGTAVPARLT